jgi:hypothetical protein
MFEPDLVRRPPTMSEMRAAAIVEVKISANRGPRFRYRVVGADVDLLMFDGPPEPFDENVVTPRTLAIHADRDLVVQQQIGEFGAGELAPLSVLKMSGLPCRAKASSTASMQKSVSSVIETRHDRARRLNQSSTTTR